MYKIREQNPKKKTNRRNILYGNYLKRESNRSDYFANLLIDWLNSEFGVVFILYIQLHFGSFVETFSFSFILHIDMCVCVCVICVTLIQKNASKQCINHMEKIDSNPNKSENCFTQKAHFSHFQWLIIATKKFNPPHTKCINEGALFIQFIVRINFVFL